MKDMIRFTVKIAIVTCAALIVSNNVKVTHNFKTESYSNPIHVSIDAKHRGSYNDPAIPIEIRQR